MFVRAPRAPEAPPPEQRFERRTVEPAAEPAPRYARSAEPVAERSEGPTYVRAQQLAVSPASDELAARDVLVAPNEELARAFAFGTLGAIGDTLTIQMDRAIVGLGDVGDVVTVIETTYIQQVIAAGWAHVYTGTGPALSTSLDSGSGECLAYIEDVSGTPTVLSTVFTQMAHMAITVPPTPDKDVWIEFGASLQVTAAGTGGILIACCEITSGALVLQATAGGGVSSSGTGFTAGAGSAFHAPPRGYRNLGQTTTERQFVLGGLVLRDGGSVLAASIRSSASNASAPAWIGAFAR